MGPTVPTEQWSHMLGVRQILEGFFFLIEEFDNNLYEINFIWPADENLAKKYASL